MSSPDISLIIALLLALFAILFGTRHADATEHQDGLVLAATSMGLMPPARGPRRYAAAMGVMTSLAAGS